MSRVAEEKMVDASKDVVWAAIAEFSSIMNFSPTVKKSYSINGSDRSGKGAERRCEFDSGGKGYIDERVIRYVEGKSMDIEIFAGTKMPPLQSMIGTLAVRDGGANRTIVTMRIDYEAKRGPIMRLMARLMVRRFLARAVHSTLAGLAPIWRRANWSNRWPRCVRRGLRPDRLKVGLKAGGPRGKCAGLLLSRAFSPGRSDGRCRPRGWWVISLSGSER